jgi:hypothetical protein
VSSRPGAWVATSAARDGCDLPRRDELVALGLWLLVLVGAAALVVAGMLRDARPAK